MPGATPPLGAGRASAEDRSTVCVFEGVWEDFWAEARLVGDSAIGRTEIDKEEIVSEDENRRIAANEEGDVEAHNRRVAAKEDPDEQRRAGGNDDEGDEVEAHTRRVSTRRVS
jgi:hypothetical protein